MMRVFRACHLFPDRRLARRLGSEQFYNFWALRIPCWQGKMQGISPIQPLFAEIRVENLFELSYLRENSLCRQQGIISREQGITSALSSGAGNLARPGQSSKSAHVVDK
jgi:hypothetical protein